MAGIITKKIINYMIDNHDVCGSCLCKSEKLDRLDTIYVIDNKHYTLSNIMKSVYGYSIDNQLATQNLCNNCINTILKAYLFIRNIKLMNDILKKISEQIDMKIINEIDFQEYEISEKPIKEVVKTLEGSIEKTQAEISKVKTITTTCIYECGFCNNTFKKYKEILSHIKVHKYNDFQCKHCCMSFQKLQSLIKHRKQTHKDKIYHCNICNIIFLRNIGRKHYLKRHINSFYVCDYCDNVLYTKTSLKKHTNKHLYSKDEEANCNQRGSNTEDFNYKMDLTDHTIKHKDELTCSKCPTRKCKKCHTLFTSKDLLEHTQLCSSRYKCEDCDATFLSLINYKYHIRKHNRPTLKKDSECPYCNKLFDKYSIKRHMKWHANVLVKKPPRKGIPCDICGTILINEKSLQNHIETHKDHVRCATCLKYINETDYEKHLKIHVKIKSRKRKDFHCARCDYTSNFHDCLEAHINRYHLNIRPFKCEQCDKQFYAKSTMKEHVKTHLRVKPEQCDICGHTFVSKKALKTHVRLHTGEKPYPCDLCSEKFLSASRRQAHRIRKHFDPTFQCDICLKMYYTKSAVRIHKRDSHSEKKVDKADMKTNDSLH